MCRSVFLFDKPFLLQFQGPLHIEFFGFTPDLITFIDDAGASGGLLQDRAGRHALRVIVFHVGKYPTQEEENDVKTRKELHKSKLGWYVFQSRVFASALSSIYKDHFYVETASVVYISTNAQTRPAQQHDTYTFNSDKRDIFSTGDLTTLLVKALDMHE